MHATNAGYHAADTDPHASNPYAYSSANYELWAKAFAERRADLLQSWEIGSMAVLLEGREAAATGAGGVCPYPDGLESELWTAGYESQRDEMLTDIAAASPRLSRLNAIRPREWTWSRSKLIAAINGLTVWELGAGINFFPKTYASAEADPERALADVWRRAAQ